MNNKVIIREYPKVKPIFKYKAFIVLVCFIVVGGLGGYLTVRHLFENRDISKLSGLKTQVISLHGKPYTVVVARTSEARERGLSGTVTIPYDGMLFDFEEDSLPGFWMKDMNYSLDIIWLDHNYEIVDIIEDLKPNTYPTVFYPKKPVRYVIEFPSGFVSKEQVQLGTHVGIGEEVK